MKTTPTSTLLLTLLAVLSAGALSILPASADNSSAPPPRLLTVVGHAVVKVTPDEMNWNFQVSVNDATLAKAKQRHDASLTAALDYLKGLGASIKDTQTGGIRFEKIMYPVGDPNVLRKPFTVSTSVTFTLTDFSKYGDVADALAKLDGLQVNGVDYSYSKADEAGRDAMKKAMLDAKAKAQDLATAADAELNGVYYVTDSATPVFRPMMRMNAMAAPMAMSSMGTPAAVPGQIEIEGNVTATYGIYAVAQAPGTGK